MIQQGFFNEFDPMDLWGEVDAVNVLDTKFNLEIADITAASVVLERDQTKRGDEKCTNSQIRLKTVFKVNACRCKNKAWNYETTFIKGFQGNCNTVK